MNFTAISILEQTRLKVKGYRGEIHSGIALRSAVYRRCQITTIISAATYFSPSRPKVYPQRLLH
jgi:hypothetical protein